MGRNFTHSPRQFFLNVREPTVSIAAGGSSVSSAFESKPMPKPKTLKVSSCNVSKPQHKTCAMYAGVDARLHGRINETKVQFKGFGTMAYGTKCDVNKTTASARDKCANIRRNVTIDWTVKESVSGERY